MVSSPEFIADNGGTSDGTANGIPSQQLITVLFQDALGRKPMQSEFSYFSNLPLTQSLQDIFGSPEYEGYTVDVYYQDFFRRTANMGEADYWMTFYPNGSRAGLAPAAGVQPDVEIMAGFIGSQEYITKALTHPQGMGPLPTDPLQVSIP